MNILDKLIEWFDERTGLKKPIVDMMVHPVPRNANWMYVLGSATLTSLVVQLVTGVCLATLYIPSASAAHQSLWYITTQAPFGSLVRGIHFFGASSMVLFVGLHALRVYLTASYKFPRELNWLTGVILLFTTVAIAFTGQVLRWDQTAVWTVAVGAEQALRMPVIGKYLVNVLMSGGTINSQTLSHFFALHVFIFPAVLLSVLGLHLWLVLYNGISEPPVTGKPVDPKTYKKEYHELVTTTGKPFWPDAAWRDVVFSTALVSVIVALAIFIGPPHIEKPPDPSIVNAMPKPDWYLLWYFSLLAITPHRAEDYLIILGPLLAIIGLLIVPFINNKGERSVKRRPWAIAYVVLISTFIGTLLVEGFREPWTPAFSAVPLPKEIIGADSGPVYDGAQVFNERGCLYCHMISGHGGERGPDLTDVGDRLTHDQIVIRIVNGGYNMPGYAGNISPKDLASITTFLESRKVYMQK
ncbi:MAG TPA: cytochrome b N-terminal domain-containing protein [Planktothrix sp.]